MIKKLFVVKKYIMANSASEAIKKEKKVPVDDVWIDEKWKELNTPLFDQQVKGFSVKSSTKK